MGLSLYDRWKQMNQATSAPSASDSADLVDISSTQTLTNKTMSGPTITGTVTGTYTLGGTPTISSQTGAPYLSDVTNVGGGKKIAYGTGALVSGTLTVNTGLTIVGFTATLLTAPTSTGNTCSQALAYVVSGSSGAVVTSYYVTVASAASGTMAAATGSSGSFAWIAIGS